MTYIYDVLLNFTDDYDRIEFFEWQENDCYEHIKKIPLFKISSSDMINICQNRIKLSKKFIEDIKGKTISYKNKKDIKYASLFTDQNKVIALEFDSKGQTISHSSLLIDEEEDIAEDSIDEEITKIEYEKIYTYKTDPFLTRKETKRKKFLLQELAMLHKEKDLDKFNYLYEEVFKKDNLSFENRYKKIVNDLENNYNPKYNELYDIVCLSYKKG